MPQFVAIYLGSADATAGPGDMSPEDIGRGMAAWGQWMEDHAAAVVVQGGPLGKTKRVSRAGVADVSNLMSGFIVVEAESHEAAAKMFENHPHFTIFPGEAVEVMPLLPIPTQP